MSKIEWRSKRDLAYLVGRLETAIETKDKIEYRQILSAIKTLIESL